MRNAEDKTIAVIDGNSLLHRAFHAVPQNMSAPDGRHTNACFGFLSMLLKLVEEFTPTGVICAFDAGVPAFRFEAIEKYKAQRPPTPTDLKEQFPIIKELLVALGIPVISAQGWEGDDILGTIATRAEAQGNIRTLLVTGDKDALQLATERTQIITTKIGMSEVVVYDPAAVVKRFGVKPALVPDYLGLMGDASDNIPGVPGVGPKKATALLQEYGTMDAVLERAGEITGKLGENLRDNREQALASRRVATIVRDVDIDLDFDSVSFPNFDTAEVRRVFGQYSLNTHLRKILKLAEEGVQAKTHATAAPEVRVQAAVPGARVQTRSTSAESAESPPMLITSIDQKLLTGKEAQTALEAYLNKDTQGSPPLVLLHFEETIAASLFEQSKRRLYIAIQNSTLCFEDDALLPALALCFKRAQVVAFSIKALLQELVPCDSSLPALLEITQVIPARLFDLSVVAYLLDSAKSYPTIKEMAAGWLCGFEIKPENEQGQKTSLQENPSQKEREPHDPGDLSVEHDSGVASLTLAHALYRLFEEKLRLDKDLASCYHTIESPLIPVLVAMERTGVTVDSEVLKGLSAQFAEKIDAQRTEAYELAGEEFNLDSPKQLGVILFEKLKLPPLKKKQTGYSTDASVLQELKTLNPLPALMLEYRELAKLKSTYLDALPALILKDKRLHTSFNQTVTATGRLSSSDPNLQNIPVRTDLGRQIRTAFIANASAFKEQKAVFLSADYSQIELRLLAHLSGDEHLINAFITGEDFHASTAARVFGVPSGEVTPKMRSRAKAVNFGIVYGQQAYGLSQSLDIPFGEAQEMIKRYFAAYPQVKVYLDETVAAAYDQGWASTLFGRKRHVPELRAGNVNQRNFGERIAMNHPMQGSAA
ncbi:MAG: DNA polymerase I, partial [Coriobacteriia bacterium]|nr:DNA polymerase I [Coriobacteriia bacterium]